jgi:hypothetical protein
MLSLRSGEERAEPWNLIGDVTYTWAASVTPEGATLG